MIYLPLVGLEGKRVHWKCPVAKFFPCKSTEQKQNISSNDRFTVKPTRENNTYLLRQMEAQDAIYCSSFCPGVTGFLLQMHLKTWWFPLKSPLEEGNNFASLKQKNISSSELASLQNHQGKLNHILTPMDEYPTNRAGAEKQRKQQKHIQTNNTYSFLRPMDRTEFFLRQAHPPRAAASSPCLGRWACPAAAASWRRRPRPPRSRTTCPAPQNSAPGSDPREATNTFGGVNSATLPVVMFDSRGRGLGGAALTGPEALK